MAQAGVVKREKKRTNHDSLENKWMFTAWPSLHTGSLCPPLPCLHSHFFSDLFFFFLLLLVWISVLSCFWLSLCSPFSLSAASHDPSVIFDSVICCVLKAIIMPHLYFEKNDGCLPRVMRQLCFWKACLVLWGSSVITHNSCSYAHARTPIHTYPQNRLGMANKSPLMFEMF